MRFVGELDSKYDAERVAPGMGGSVRSTGESLASSWPPAQRMRAPRRNVPPTAGHCTCIRWQWMAKGERHWATRSTFRGRPCQPPTHLRIAERILEKSHYYQVARDFARMVSEADRGTVAGLRFVIMNGGGPGIMEAGNRGAFEAGRESVGMNITLPTEQLPNPYITPELCFQFRYFALRKLHFLKRVSFAESAQPIWQTIEQWYGTRSG